MPPDTDHFQNLTPTLYAELRGLAGAAFLKERSDLTIQPTSVVHEAYLRLVQQRADLPTREHFLAMAATMMRRILVDHARARAAQKRGGDWRRVTLANISADERLIDVLDLDEAMTALACVHERAARVVELRQFGGMTAAETAVALGVSERTVKGDWAYAVAWLHRHLGGGDDGL